MKVNKKVSLVGLLLALTGLAAPLSAQAGADVETCQAGYRELLMTAGECRAYLRDLRAAEARADLSAMLDLQEWHAELLIERARRCPCHAARADVQPLSRAAVASGPLVRSAQR